MTGAEIPTVNADRRPGDPAALVAANDLFRAGLGWSPLKPELTTMIADASDRRRMHPDGYAR